MVYHWTIQKGSGVPKEASEVKIAIIVVVVTAAVLLIGICNGFQLHRMFNNPINTTPAPTTTR